MTARLRVRSSTLEARGDRLFFEGAPFTGIAFEESAGLVPDAQEVEEGVPGALYRSPFFTAPEGAPHVSSACPDIAGSKDYPEIIQFFYRGAAFTGVYYEFQGPYCTYEGLISGGWAEIETDWYADGGLEAYASPTADYDFDRGGRLRYLCINRHKHCGLQVNLSAEGRLASIRALGPILSILDDLAAKLPFDHIRQPSDLTRYPAADRLDLSDRGIRDTLLASLLKAGCLDATTGLCLSGTAITADALDGLASLPSLRTLEISERGAALKDAVAALKRRRPDLDIDYKSR